MLSLATVDDIDHRIDRQKQHADEWHKVRAKDRRHGNDTDRHQRSPHGAAHPAPLPQELDKRSQNPNGGPQWISFALEPGSRNAAASLLEETEEMKKRRRCALIAVDA